MNIIRTKVVELNTIPAVAYKVKLKSGGSGVKIHRTDKEVSAFANVSTSTGEAQPDTRVVEADFPMAAFEEAIDAVRGLPYSARGNVKIAVVDTVEADEIEVPEDELPGTHDNAIANAIDSNEFVAIVDMYSDVSGKVNFKLMNKQFIQFASRSKFVADLAGSGATEADILLHIVKNRAAYLAGEKNNLSDEATCALIDALEDMNTRSAFKDLKLHIRKILSR